MDQQEMRPLERISAAKTETLEGPRSDRIVHQAEMSVLDFARAYRALGWSIVPLIPRSKRPFLPWTELQYTHAENERLADWWPAGGTNSLGVVSGAISGIVVVDIDGPEGEQTVANLEVPITPTVLTARGRHLYFSHPGVGVTSRAGLYPQVDVRGDGGLVVAPPSIHQSGHVYAWAPGLSPWEVPLAECPAWVYEPDRTAEPSHGVGTAPLGSWQERVVQGVREGARNATVASLTGHLFAGNVDPRVAEALVHAWAKARTHPRLDEDEVQGVIDSIAHRELAIRRSP